MSKPADPKRARRIKYLVELGVPKTKIAAHFGINRSRVYQILAQENGRTNSGKK